MPSERTARHSLTSCKSPPALFPQPASSNVRYSTRFRPPQNYLRRRAPSGAAQRPVFVIRNSFNRRPGANPPNENTPVDLPLQYVRDALCHYVFEGMGRRSCNLCWLEIRPHDIVVLTPCVPQHWFHEVCGALSMMQRGRCPVCKEWLVDQV